ncbi:hypothetical protein CJ203_01555 [Corynebacterium tuscaniense]|uniref:1-deoxy-D-xylulose-5-phosphate synthase n=2 Tax=Corynebacterium tuscaniense TaxID=302449 RepID=A0A2N6T739_9CORY|nr:hypothetical protein CJ203_01555 [Corynebacterium tuscaniense]
MRIGGTRATGPDAVSSLCASNAPAVGALTFWIMAPVNVDKASLTAQLADDSVAFETDNPMNLLIEPDLLRAVNEASTQEGGPFGYVVLETVGAGPGALRDLAQELLEGTNAHTMIVRAPDATAAVSTELTRAQIEKSEFALIRQPDYAQGIDAFVASIADSGEPHWGTLGAILAALIVLVAVVTHWTVKR